MKPLRRWIAGALVAGLVAGCSSKPAPPSAPAPAREKLNMNDQGGAKGRVGGDTDR
jgi:uncharacterized lipoprotein YbaY